MLEKYIRPFYQLFFLSPFARVVSRASFLSPTRITLIGCFLGVIAAIFIGYSEKWLAVTFLSLSGFCDTLDGTLARMCQKSTPLGTVLDIAADRIVEAAVIIGLYCVAPETRGLICLVMLASVLVCVTSFLIVGIFSENTSDKSFYYSPGLIERPEAFVFFLLMILFPSLFQVFGWVFSVLVVVTALFRLIQFSRQQAPNT